MIEESLIADSGKERGSEDDIGEYLYHSQKQQNCKSEKSILNAKQNQKNNFGIITEKNPSLKKSNYSKLAQSQISQDLLAETQLNKDEEKELESRGDKSKVTVGCFQKIKQLEFGTDDNFEKNGLRLKEDILECQHALNYELVGLVIDELTKQRMEVEQEFQKQNKRMESKVEDILNRLQETMANKRDYPDSVAEKASRMTSQIMSQIRWQKQDVCWPSPNKRIQETPQHPKLSNQIDDFYERIEHIRNMGQFSYEQNGPNDFVSNDVYLKVIENEILEELMDDCLKMFLI